MQTSIEWLRNELWEQFNFSFSDNIFEQAKEMHYREIMDSMQRGMELQEKENNRIGFRERNGLLPQQEISDEEIREQAIKYDNGAFSETPIAHFIEGAFWYREQLKNNGNEKL
jgi:hypothetical protein